MNSGVNGDTTRLALAGIDRGVFQHNPNLLIVMFGLNDALSPHRGLSLEEYENNLRLIVELASYRGVRVVLTTPNPVIEKLRGTAPGGAREAPKVREAPRVEPEHHYEEPRGWAG